MAFNKREPTQKRSPPEADEHFNPPPADYWALDVFLKSIIVPSIISWHMDTIIKATVDEI
jgi:hypothetical protein